MTSHRLTGRGSRLAERQRRRETNAGKALAREEEEKGTTEQGRETYGQECISRKARVPGGKRRATGRQEEGGRQPEYERRLREGIARGRGERGGDIERGLPPQPLPAPNTHTEDRRRKGGGGTPPPLRVSSPRQAKEVRMGVPRWRRAEWERQGRATPQATRKKGAGVCSRLGG